ncbi:phosphoribosylamine--glycine ligase [Candidatus Micrarchaeota archaeon]|nr:phosphoribosylamine--glycine ligase [Candidatus Micrarchaeota archaeon]
MKVVLVGNGAREHIIAEKLAEHCDLYAIMSKKNPAIAQLSVKYWLCDINNVNEVANIVHDNEFDLAFSSPDATLEAGISNVFENAGILVASPSKSASRIEWDKGFMRTIMKNHKIKGSPKHEVVDNVDGAVKAIRDYGQVAIKPLGLSGGKGVKVSGDHFDSIDEKIGYAQELIRKDGCVLIEEKLIGEEFTLQAFSDGSRIAVMPPVQDHKRAYAGDSGANTGGMGSYSTGANLPFLEKSDLDDATKILKEIIHALKKEEVPFRGILYGQFMATADGLKVIEFNARFGDPEAMNVLSLLKTSLVDIFLSMAEGRLSKPEFSDECTVLKYLVPEGYPDSPKKDAEVLIDSFGIEKCGASLYYASVYEKDGKILTTSSRAFGVLGKAKTLEEAEKIAENGCNFVKGPVWHREDIGTQELVNKRITNMKSLRSS